MRSAYGWAGASVYLSLIGRGFAWTFAEHVSLRLCVSISRRRARVWCSSARREAGEVLSLSERKRGSSARRLRMECRGHPAHHWNARAESQSIDRSRPNGKRHHLCYSLTSTGFTPPKQVPAARETLKIGWREYHTPSQSSIRAHQPKAESSSSHVARALRRHLRHHGAEPAQEALRPWCVVVLPRDAMSDRSMALRWRRPTGCNKCLTPIWPYHQNSPLRVRPPLISRPHRG